MTRVVFLGTPEIAVVTLQVLIDDPEFEVVGVVTQPDRPAGRGKHLRASPVKEVASRLSIPIWQPVRVRGNPEGQSFLEATSPEVMVVVAFGQILPAVFFDWPPLGTLNLHTSLLPSYRGAAPVIRAIEHGEVETGVTIMRIDAGMDTGAILSREVVPIGPDETAGELESRLAEVGAALLVKTLREYRKGILPGQPQEDSRATYAPPLAKEEARLDWNLPAPALHDRIRAFNPRPGAFTLSRGEILKIWRSRRVPEDGRAPVDPGMILKLDSSSMTVACGGGSRLEILELQPANRRRMTAADFANGQFAAPGERLG